MNLHDKLNISTAELRALLTEARQRIHQCVL